MFALPVAAWLVWTAQAAGPDPSVPVDEPPIGGELPAGPQGLRSFQDALADAKSQYFLGKVDEAAAILDELRIRLSAGETVDKAVSAEALVYLGEIRHLQGDDSAARALFREVLLADLDQPVSPYEHPMAVIGLFETVRIAVRTELERPDAPPMVKQKLPAWGFAPFGLPQFAQRRPGSGAAFATAQVATLAVSIGMFVDLNRCRPEAWTIEGCGARDQALDTLRYGIQWPATLGFYGLWALSAADGAAVWRREAPEVPAKPQRPARSRNSLVPAPSFVPAPLVIAPRTDGLTLAFSARF